MWRADGGAAPIVCPLEAPVPSTAGRPKRRHGSCVTANILWCPTWAAELPSEAGLEVLGAPRERGGGDGVTSVTAASCAQCIQPGLNFSSGRPFDGSKFRSVYVAFFIGSGADAKHVELIVYRTSRLRLYGSFPT